MTTYALVIIALSFLALGGILALYSVCVSIPDCYRQARRIWRKK